MVINSTLGRVAYSSSALRPPSPRLVELGKFLMARRAKVTPPEVGLPASGKRRTPGLRREEVALLAGVGLSWYTWIEQGRAENVSGDVLDAISRVLGLDNSQRMYLRRLAGLSTEHSSSPPTPEPPQWRPFVDNWMPNPAYIADRYWNVVVANEAARTLFGMDGSSTNVIRSFFADKNVRFRRPFWEEDAQDIVGRFRARAANWVEDPRFVTLIESLKLDSPEFAELWSRHEVVEDSCGTDIFEHETLGNLSFTRATLDFTSRTELRLTVFTPIPETGTTENLEKAFWRH